MPMNFMITVLMFCIFKVEWCRGHPKPHCLKICNIFTIFESYFVCLVCCNFLVNGVKLSLSVLGCDGLLIKWTLATYVDCKIIVYRWNCPDKWFFSSEAWTNTCMTKSSFNYNSKCVGGLLKQYHWVKLSKQLQKEGKTRLLEGHCA